MSAIRPIAFSLALLALAACQNSDLAEPPAPLGPFRLGLNIAVADNIQKVPISREATKEQWEAAIEKAVQDRFGRYQGEKLYDIGIAIDGYALAPPGIPVVLKPKSILVITANIWDDAAKKKLNPEGKQIMVFEKASPETFIGSGLTQSKEKQMEVLSYNAVKKVEQWLLTNPEWFGLPPKGTKAAATPEVTTPAAVAAPVAAPAKAPVVPAAPVKAAPKVTQRAAAKPATPPVLLPNPAGTVP
ncbi:hypothetical protein [Fuscibacter oryzae]|uniref:hypothetical protein n=1 Tax=Fuscibacter oryzae TaxID=2803939 RepID=UPI001F2944D7|nr:hypothetical protein [Fuscibacter oryzae]